MFMRRVGIDQAIVTKMMHVLNERFDAFPDFAISGDQA
jgi:hypothetical protein